MIAGAKMFWGIWNRREKSFVPIYRSVAFRAYSERESARWEAGGDREVRPLAISLSEYRRLRDALELASRGLGLVANPSKPMQIIIDEVNCELAAADALLGQAASPEAP